MVAFSVIAVAIVGFVVGYILRGRAADDVVVSWGIFIDHIHKRLDAAYVKGDAELREEVKKVLPVLESVAPKVVSEL